MRSRRGGRARRWFGGGGGRRRGLLGRRRFRGRGGGRANGGRLRRGRAFRGRRRRFHLRLRSGPPSRRRLGRSRGQPLADLDHLVRVKPREDTGLPGDTPLLDPVEQLLTLHSQLSGQLMNTGGQRQLLLVIRTVPPDSRRTISIGWVNQSTRPTLLLNNPANRSVSPRPSVDRKVYRKRGEADQSGGSWGVARSDAGKTPARGLMVCSCPVHDPRPGRPGTAPQGAFGTNSRRPPPRRSPAGWGEGPTPPRLRRVGPSRLDPDY